MDDIVIVSAARTPVGSFNGALGTLSAHELGTVALQAAFERAGVEAVDHEAHAVGFPRLVGGVVDDAEDGRRALDELDVEF